ncbi:hypothetical protein LINGRAHAP2_LOCUS18789 [Linum grandiflorum]
MASSGSASKAWGVAVSIGAVEALKDQLGFCRWNHVFRSAQQYAGRNYKAGAIFSQSSTNNSKVSSCDGLEQRGNRAEESLKTVMYLSCWGPYT